MFPEPIQKLINHFQKLPGIGPKQGAKFAFRILSMSNSEAELFARDIINAKDKIGVCNECFLSFAKDQRELCSICASNQRSRRTICIVERDQDVRAIELTGVFKGVYHVLKPSSIPAFAINESHPSVVKLLKKVSGSSDPQEVILAFNATTEGQTTTLMIEKILLEATKNIKITRLGRGFSSGIEVEYADKDTIIDALQNRK